MLRPWLLMASVVCGFLSVGCGKKETPLAVNSPAPAGSGEVSSGSAGESATLDLGSSGGSVPPGGEMSFEDGSSAGSSNSGGAQMGISGGSGGDGYSNGGEGDGSGIPSMFGGANPGMQAGGNNPNMVRRNLPPPKPKKLTAKERATIAFEAGNMTRAYSLYHAHALMGDDDQSSEISEEMRWAARRPQIGLKVAVGLAMKNPANVASGSLKPIGTDVQSILGALAGGGAGGPGVNAGGGDEMGIASGGPGFNGMEPNGAAPPKAVRAKPLADAAGLFAEKVVEAFRDELSSGALTVAFQEYPMSNRPGASFLKGYAPNAGAPGMGGGMGMPGGDGFNGDMGMPSGSGMNGDMGFPGAAGLANPGNGESMDNSGGFSGAAVDGGAALPGGMIPGRRQFFLPRQSGQSGADALEIGGSSGEGAVSRPAKPTGFADGTPGDRSSSGGQIPGIQNPGGMNPGGQMPGGQMFGSGDGSQGGDGMGFQGQVQLPPPPNISKEVRPPEGVTPLAACLHYIGSDEQSKLIKKAYEGGYDALLVFEVEIAQNRMTKVVNNSARVKAIIPAETQKEAKIVIASSELVNVTVAKAKAKNQNDGVEDAANRVIKKLIEAIALKDIPDKLTPEAVISNRIPKLLKEEGLSKLEKLGEISFYYSKGFIDESQRNDFFSKIAGKFANQLMTGTDEEKEEALSELLGD
jgi:hypothetical protein